MTVNEVKIYDVLATAKRSVRIIGVVSLDADLEELGEVWSKHIASNPDFRVSILCESDNFLFAKSFLSDQENAKSRKSFKELQFRRRLASRELCEYFYERKIANFFVEISYLPLPLSIVEVDDVIYANPSFGEIDSKYIEIESNHPWADKVKSYIENLFEPKIGRKYASAEFDAKGHEKEVLELYDHDRLPRGAYPRSSFYDTDFSQLVVWALIFDRTGRLLIHRRSKTAKDNQNMWDKSVGGHVDFRFDVDTSRGVIREVIEELFTDESASQPEFFDITDKGMNYLGDWRPEQRKRYPFAEINRFKNQWTFFRLPKSQPLYSPRTLPDGGVRRLRVISDVFFFVASESLTDAKLDSFENSPFKLIEPSQLKTVMDQAMRNDKVPGFDELDVPLFTPDLINIMTGDLRNSIEEFSQFIKQYLKS